MSEPIITALDLATITRRARHHGINTLGQLQCLLQIHQQREVTITDLSKTIGFTAAGGTFMVEFLASRHLITRHRSPLDRRVYHLRITDTGADVVHKILSPIPDEIGPISPISPISEIQTATPLPS